MDFNFSKRMGRRMTWIVPTGIATSVLYFYLSSHLESWIELGSGFHISAVMFVCCLLIAVQDVAIDGIVCDILNEDDYDKGALMQSLGQIVGPFLSANIYLMISSKTWCVETLGLKQELVTMNGWLHFQGVFCTVAVIVSFYLLKEPETGEKPEITTAGLLKLIPKIVLHKNTRWEILISPCFELVYTFVGRYYMIRLQDIGFSKEEVSFLDSFMIVGDLLVMVILGKMKIAKKVWKSYRYSNTICYFVVSF